MDYKPVIEAIVDKESSTIGEVAFRIIDKHDDISYDEELIFNSEPERSDVEEVVELFKEVQGEGAVGIARKAMSDYLEPEMDIDLPEKLIPKEIREKRFVSKI
jgi:hypothetical protein